MVLLQQQTDKESPASPLGAIEGISRIIRSIVGDNEAAYQDTWITLHYAGITTAKDGDTIREIARRHHRKGKDERILRDTFENAEVLEDSPAMLTEQQVEQFSTVIREVVGVYDDSFQDAWMEVLKSGTHDVDEVKSLAMGCARRNGSAVIGARFKERSLDAPLGDPDDGFTLLDVLSAPEEQTASEVDADIDADTQYVATSTGKVNRKGSFYLDEDTRVALKTMYPHDTQMAAIRKVTGLAPAERDKRPWYRWEDAIVRQRYPWGGSLACTIDIARTQNAIEHRAKQLRVKHSRHTVHKPLPDWMDANDVATACGVSYQVVTKNWFKEGLIHTVIIPGYYHGHNGVFVMPHDFQTFLSSHYYLLDPESVEPQYRQHLPEEPTLVSTSVVAAELGITKSRITHWIRKGLVDALQGCKREYFMRVEDVRRIASQPFPVVRPSVDGPTHYLYHTDEHGMYYMACRRHRAERYADEVGGGDYDPPTCKLCLIVLGNFWKKQKQLPVPEKYYRPEECLICRDPRAAGSSLCDYHTGHIKLLYGSCIVVSCCKPRAPRSLRCERHGAEYEDVMAIARAHCRGRADQFSLATALVGAKEAVAQERVTAKEAVAQERVTAKEAVIKVVDTHRVMVREAAAQRRRATKMCRLLGKLTKQRRFPRESTRRRLLSLAGLCELGSETNRA